MPFNFFFFLTDITAVALKHQLTAFLKRARRNWSCDTREPVLFAVSAQKPSKGAIFELNVTANDLTATQELKMYMFHSVPPTNIHIVSEDHSFGLLL